MTRVIVTLLLLCQPFCLRSAEVPFVEPGLPGPGNRGHSKVFIVHDARATQAFEPEPDVVASMVNRGVMAFTGKSTTAEAWTSLVTTQDVVGVKVHTSPGPLSGTRPAVAAAVVRGLLDAGLPPSHIVLWDRRLEDLRAAKFVELARSLGVRVAGAMDAGWDPRNPYENPLLGQLVFGDREFGQTASPTNKTGVLGRNSYFSRLLTQELTRLVTIAPLLNHNDAGVSGVLYTMASASTDNFLRFETHPQVMAEAVPEIFGDPRIADRVALNIVDALIGQYEGRQRSRLNRAGTPNQIWFSKDPVALDVLAIEELNRQRVLRNDPLPVSRTELYRNAHYLELGKDDPRQIDVIRVE